MSYRIDRPFWPAIVPSKRPGPTGLRLLAHGKGLMRRLRCRRHLGKGDDCSIKNDRVGVVLRGYDDRVRGVKRQGHRYHGVPKMSSLSGSSRRKKSNCIDKSQRLKSVASKPCYCPYTLTLSRFRWICAHRKPALLQLKFERNELPKMAWTRKVQWSGESSVTPENSGYSGATALSSTGSHL